MPVTPTLSQPPYISLSQTTLPLSTFNLPLSDNNFTFTRPTSHIPDPSDVDPSVLQGIEAHNIPTTRKTVRCHSQIDTSQPLRSFEFPVLEPLDSLTNRSSDIDSFTLSLFYPRLPLSTHSFSLDNLFDPPSDTSSSVSLFKPSRKRYHLGSHQIQHLEPPRYNLRSQSQAQPSDSTLTTTQSSSISCKYCF